MVRIHRILDALTILKDAGLVAVSAAAQVSAADKILDLGTGHLEAEAIIDVTAIEVATGDELYEIEFQLSNSATFASGIVATGILKLGDSSVNDGSADSKTGRYTLPVSNEFNGTLYRYARLYTKVAGTIATGINYTAYLSKRAPTAR